MFIAFVREELSEPKYNRISAVLFTLVAGNCKNQAGGRSSEVIYVTKVLNGTQKKW
jgi:hypothetical protein